MKGWIRLAVWGGIVALAAFPAWGDEWTFPPVDELPSQAGLPDPFRMADGRRVASRADWLRQRDYLKAMLAHYLYGRMPPKPAPAERTLVFQPPSPSPFGAGQRIDFEIVIARRGQSLTLRCGLIKPPGEGPFPVIIKNDRFTFDPEDEVQRAIVPEAVGRGYALCQYVRTDLAVDEAGHRHEGVFPLYPEPEYDWGTIAAWAWGYQVVIDALETQAWVDREKFVATGHSRGGKTALCGGIYDERIQLTAPNSSGTGGTASNRYFDDNASRLQTIAVHRDNRQHAAWWHPRFLEFAERADRLPFDAHTMKALIAPRGLINPHARHDLWANPYGTELTHRAARRVFAWLGTADHIAMHWRDGGHAQGVVDWTALLDFADWYFHGKQPTASRFDVLAYPDEALPVDWSTPTRGE